MTRIEHKMWWCDGELYPGVKTVREGWVPFQTHAWAPHGGWTIERKPWVIVELQPEEGPWMLYPPLSRSRWKQLQTARMWGQLDRSPPVVAAAIAAIGRRR